VRQLTVTVGAARARIVTVDVSSLITTAGNPVSICYKVENARQGEIAPIRFLGGAKTDGCTVVQPATRSM
jgi:hypothetical protein